MVLAKCSLLLGGIASVALLVPSTAFACSWFDCEDVPPPPIRVPRPVSQRPEASIRLLLTVGQNSGPAESATVFVPRFGVAIPASRHIHIGVAWGLVTGSIPRINEEGQATSVTDSETGLLNPVLDVSYSFTLPNRDFIFDFLIGAGIAFPVADADDVGRAAAYQVALGTAGAWDPFRYLPNTLGFDVPIKVRFKTPRWYFGFDGTFFLLIPTEDGNERTTQFGAQAGLEGLIKVGLFDLGARLQAVQLGSSGATDAYLQTSLQPLARLYLGALVMEAKFNFNFDEPHGTTFGDGGTWGLSIGASVFF